LKKKSLISLCATTICASTAAVSMPLTAFANVNTPSIHEKAIVVNQQPISKPYGFIHDNTTYMPVWYLMKALEKLNIHSTWHNHAWSLTTSRPLDLNDVQPGVGSSSIYVNGHLVQKVNEIVAEDPNSGQQTTYIPAWYVMKVLNRLHVNSGWDGAVWKIDTEPQAPSSQSNTRSSADHSFSSDDSNVGHPITVTEAYLLVLEKFKDQLSDPNLRVHLDHMDGKNYVFQVYDQMPPLQGDDGTTFGGHTATIAWITVTDTGNIQTTP
jgi:hypothetical protein